LTSDHEIDPETELPIGARVDATPARRPVGVVIEGRDVRLEPLERRHARELFEASSAPGAAARFRYLWDEPPREVADVERWIAAAGSDAERVAWALVAGHSGRAEGRFCLMRIAPEQRRIELGHVLLGPNLARTRAATEAVYLIARHAFEELGYRRFEWKCDALNAPSRRAALRHGFVFEGIFRRDMIVKGRSRDTAWYALTDADWPRARGAFERWLDPANFDPAGRQRRRLEELR
jgi:RimJ/RimL family protein N-acetyltransferase